MGMGMHVKAVGIRPLSPLPCTLGRRLVLVTLISLNVCACHKVAGDVCNKKEFNKAEYFYLFLWTYLILTVWMSSILQEL